MSTWSNILCKYRYVNTRAKEGRARHSFLKHAEPGIAEGVIVVACRGQSYESLEQTTWVDTCGVFVVVNDWRPGPLPELVAKHRHRAVNYLTDMRARVDRWKSCGVPSLRSSRALSINEAVAVS